MMTKNKLRKICKDNRNKIDNKAQKDRAVFNQLIALPEYKTAGTVLCYASLDGEIATDEIINYSLEQGKTVALPLCSDSSGNMSFYVINSFDELKVGRFGVREPDNSCKELTDFDNSLIIVPALCFSKDGHRLGYGKGYYDRFLQKYPLISVGLCYNSLVRNNIPYDNHDKKVDIILTESLAIRT